MGKWERRGVSRPFNRIMTSPPGEQMGITHIGKRPPAEVMLLGSPLVQCWSGYSSGGVRWRRCAARLMGGEASQIVSRPTTTAHVISCLDARIRNTHMHSDSAAESKPSRPTPGNKYGEESTIKQPSREPRRAVRFPKDRDIMSRCCWNQNARRTTLVDTGSTSQMCCVQMADHKSKFLLRL